MYGSLIFFFFINMDILFGKKVYFLLPYVDHIGEPGTKVQRKIRLWVIRAEKEELLIR